MKATYGLASPVEFQLPSTSPLWTPVAYAAIDAPRTAPNDAANSVSVKNQSVNVDEVLII